MSGFGIARTIVLTLLAVFLLEAPLAAISQQEPFTKRGRNDDVGAIIEDVWDVGGLYPWPTSAQTVRARAGNAADSAAGLGAQAIQIIGLDQDWMPAVENLILAGESPSLATTTTFIRINDVQIIASGTFTGSNFGDIDIENTDSLDILQRIPAGIGRSNSSHYSVPANCIAQVSRLVANAVATGIAASADVHFSLRFDGDKVTPPFGATQTPLIIRGLSGIHEELFVTRPSFPRRTDIWASAIRNGGNVSVAVTFDIVLIHIDPE